MTKGRKIALALVALTALAAPAIACMGILIHTEVVFGGVICTYQLSNGQNVRVSYPGAYSCPSCME